MSKDAILLKRTVAGKKPFVPSPGLYGKYVIQKVDGSLIDPKAVYFTLRLDTDQHARAAIRAYIESCRKDEPELAADLERVLREVGG